MKKEIKSLVEIHIAVFLFGLSGLFGKLLDLPSTIIVLGRVFFASLTLLLLIFYFKESLRLDYVKDYLLLPSLGTLLAIHWVSFFYSIQISTVAVGLLTFATFPLFVTFLEPIFFREHLKLKDVLLALLAFIGVLFIIPEFSFSNSVTLGVFWGLISVFTMAILSLLNRNYVKRYSSLAIAFYQDSFATLLLLPFFFLSQVVFNLQDLLLLVVLGVVFTALSHTLFIKGLSHIKVHTASVVATLEPMYGILFAIAILNEIPTLRVVFGGTIVLLAVFFATTTAKTSKVVLPE